MPLVSLTKQPGESRRYTMDFSPLLEAGEVLASVDSVSAVPDGELVFAGEEVASGVYARERISGGDTQTKYKVTFVVTTSLGNTLNGEGILQVRDL